MDLLLQAEFHEQRGVAAMMPGLFTGIAAEVDKLVAKWLSQLHAFNAVTRVPEPPPVTTIAEMSAEIERLRPPKRVLLVSPERVDHVRAVLAEMIAQECDWGVAAALEHIEVRGDVDGVFVRDTDEGWLLPGETVRFW